MDPLATWHRAGNLKDRQTDGDITWPTAQFPTDRDKKGRRVRWRRRSCYRLPRKIFDTAPSCGGSYFQHPFIRRLERMKQEGGGGVRSLCPKEQMQIKSMAGYFLKHFYWWKDKSHTDVLRFWQSVREVNCQLQLVELSLLWPTESVCRNNNLEASNANLCFVVSQENKSGFLLSSEANCRESTQYIMLLNCLTKFLPKQVRCTIKSFVPVCILPSPLLIPDPQSYFLVAPELHCGCRSG